MFSDLLQDILDKLISRSAGCVSIIIYLFIFLLSKNNIKWIRKHLVSLRKNCLNSGGTEIQS